MFQAGLNEPEECRSVSEYHHYPFICKGGFETPQTFSKVRNVSNLRRIELLVEIRPMKPLKGQNNFIFLDFMNYCCCLN